MLCCFGKLTYTVKTRLFQAYCNSRYGCELWSLDDSRINEFCHTSMTRLPIVIGVQLSHYWIS